jgi:hypothetical protein
MLCNEALPFSSCRFHRMDPHCQAGIDSGPTATLSDRSVVINAKEGGKLSNMELNKGNNRIARNCGQDEGKIVLR